jgi:hypothetical protein
MAASGHIPTHAPHDMHTSPEDEMCWFFFDMVLQLEVDGAIRLSTFNLS